MLDFDLIKNTLIIGMASGIVTTALIQKIKENLNTKKWLTLISFAINMVVGTLFAFSFSTVSIIDSLWVGLFSFVEADMLYQMFEEKIFKSFSSIEKTVAIPVENKIGDDSK